MALEIKRNEENNKIWSHLRQDWYNETPEERVRQEYLCVLVNEYGFALEQIGEEIPVTERGCGQARADFLIWRSPAAKTGKETPLIVVECKADNVTIDARTYTQGANYAQYSKARFFVTHNNRETKYWKVDHAKMMPNFDEIENIPHADASDKQIEELIAKLKTFKEDEFADLLHKCHNIIRNREHLDPAAAFDEIAKILFVKTGVERKLKQGRQRLNLFTAEFLDQQKVVLDDPINALFNQTKAEFKADRIFADDDKINLKHPTVVAIVKELERYNLSDTSEDIKGIAFERFLGRTFRGEIGQFFTPRPIVEFMVRMLQPQEGEIVCDPASGSGGFLIRVFELVRQQILADADRQYQAFKAEIEANTGMDEAAKAKALSEKFTAIQATLDQSREGSRMWQLSNRSIYGTDANDRMARTSKMNMIMHGDGHGGVHHHNGFLNVNGIFEGRFDIILTNPPFGANVEPTDIVQEAEVALAPEIERLYLERYGNQYREASARLQAAAKAQQAIAALFKLPRSAAAKIKTEILFIERCLDLLKPGGRLGIVLPEGVFNNPSLAYVRQFVEDRAFVRAVVSLPQETFFSSGASVKASLLFLQKFSEAEQADFDAKQADARQEVEAAHADEIAAEHTRLQAAIDAAKVAKDSEARKAAAKALAEYDKRMAAKIAEEARALLKQRFNYPVFLYEAEKVGITATGEADENELYDNPRLPAGVAQTALEAYRQFLEDPEPFFV